MFSRKIFVIAFFTAQTVLLTNFSSPVQAGEKEPARTPSNDDAPLIFDVRRSFPLEPDEPVFHDFYINAGIEAGIKKGEFLPVLRQMPVHDPIQNKQQGMLTVAVGKLQVIQVERNISVARAVSENSDEERPTLEYEAIMIGDRIDLRGASMEAPANPPTQKSRHKRKAASREEATPTAPVPATAPVLSPSPEKASLAVPPPKA